MDGKFPWTEGGLELLQTIMQVIDKNGGYSNMADIVITECPEFFREEVFEKSRARLRNKGIATFTIDKRAIARDTPRYHNYTQWSQTEDRFLLTEHGKLTIEEMSVILKRTDRSVHRRLWILRTRKKAA